MLGKFEILRKIATGGMAEIYLARVRGAAGFEKLFVLKRVLPSVAGDPRLIQMFLDEARLAATLQHPNIADVHEVGEDRGAPFFAMEFVHGQDVRTIRLVESKQHQGVPLRVSLAILHATASALAYAHDRSDATGANLNLVHRDVSPSNILVSYEGAIKLIDFGVARVTNQRHLTQAGTIRGKYPYMSPEQCRGLALDRRSDLFSLGIVLYELTVGRRPFRGESDFDVMTQIVHHDAERPTRVVEGYPPDLEDIVMTLLAREPDARFQTADQLLHEIEGFLESNHLWVPNTKLARYMRKLFAARLVGWDEAQRGDLVTLADHLALGMEPGHRRAGDAVTPPTPLPVTMRLSQEIRAVAMDSDVSLARVYKPDDPEDPMSAILGTENLEDSVVFANPDTLPGQTSKAEMESVLDASVGPMPAGETVTTREPEAMHVDLPPVPGLPGRGQLATPPSGTAAQHRADTEPAGLGSDPGGDTTTVRKDSREAAELSHEAMLAADADSVMRALHAQSFVAAIDALGAEPLPRTPVPPAKAPAAPPRTTRLLTPPPVALQRAPNMRSGPARQPAAPTAKLRPTYPQRWQPRIAIAVAVALVLLGLIVVWIRR